MLIKARACIVVGKVVKMVCVDEPWICLSGFLEWIYWH